MRRQPAARDIRASHDGIDPPSPAGEAPIDLATTMTGLPEIIEAVADRDPDAAEAAMLALTAFIELGIG